MKTKASAALLAVSLLMAALSGCLTEPAVIANNPGEAGHIGCQEREIDEDGTCVPAEDNNAGLFGQDLDAYVITMDVKDGANGFLAKPRAEGDYPGVVMIHEWWGLNDNVREMAKILAKEGYVVFAVDLYGGEVAVNSTQAGQLASSVRNNPPMAVREMKAAVEYLRREENVGRVGSLGWCFGGGQSLQLALNERLDATVIYYGQLVTDKEELKRIEWPVLGIFGEKDTGIPVSSVKGFESSLNDLGIENEVYVYPGVGHAFANPSGSNYAKNETNDAWGKTVAFLDRNLKARKY